MLKRSPNDLRSLFRLDNPQQLQADQRAEKMQKKEGESRKQNGEGRGKRRAKDKEHNAMEMEVDEEWMNIFDHLTHKSHHIDWPFSSESKNI